MIITENTEYKGHGKKYDIKDGYKAYTCYIQPSNYASNFVVTGNGKQPGKVVYSYSDGIMTEIGKTIYDHCSALYSKR